ncbi:MAG: hypothetical protein FGM18_02300 [Burkholderiaceae bacterium]|nr:hypothetical protein [Burkholderiaceae bacterium]
MKRLVIFVVVIVLGVAAAMLLELTWGNVTLWLPPYRIDMSLEVALIGLVLVFALLLILARVVVEVLDIPDRVRRYRKRRLQDQRLRKLSDLTVDFFEGRFARVVKAARVIQEDEDLARQVPLALVASNALAAGAAHRLRDTVLRDDFVESLRIGAPDPAMKDSTLAALLEAEFAIDDHKGQRALAALAPLTRGDRRNVHTLRLALRANQQQGRWDEVLRIARLLENRKAIPSVLALGLKREVADAWIGLGRHQEAIELIEATLKTQWDSGLAFLYGRCEGNAKEQLIRLESWLRQQPRDAELNWAMGRLCQRQALWGKARQHLEASLRIKPMLATHLALAEVAESLSEKETAAFHWKAAAQLTS